ncbi:MAG: substrate-binding domain-containing protein [Clostridia bacterium]|nr:substrate-binding domain-containing protein [Clostridia bacterium]
MSITIKEIAEMAGVSRGTVDRVLHKRSGVSRENIQKVNEIIKKYNFQPNPIGKALASRQKTKKIGIILNCIGNRFFDDVIEGIENSKKELANYGAEIIIKKLEGYNEKEQTDAICEMEKEKIDGLIITPVNGKEIKNKIESINIPVITCNVDIDVKNKIGYAGCDYNVSGKLAAAVLVMHAFGKKLNVGIVHGSKNIKGHMERYEAFKSTASKCPNINIIDYFYTEDNSGTAYEKTSEMIKKHNIDFVYVVASGIDGVMEAIERSGKTIYAVTNDVLPITLKYLEKDVIKATVYQHPYKQGYNSVAQMINYLYTGNTNGSNYKINSELITKYNIPEKEM